VTSVGGEVAPGFERVRDAFGGNFARNGAAELAGAVQACLR